MRRPSSASLRGCTIAGRRNGSRRVGAGGPNAATNSRPRRTSSRMRNCPRRTRTSTAPPPSPRSGTSTKRGSALSPRTPPLTRALTTPRLLRPNWPPRRRFASKPSMPSGADIPRRSGKPMRVWPHGSRKSPATRGGPCSLTTWPRVCSQARHRCRPPRRPECATSPCFPSWRSARSSAPPRNWTRSEMAHRLTPISTASGDVSPKCRVSGRRHRTMPAVGSEKPVKFMAPPTPNPWAASVNRGAGVRARMPIISASTPPHSPHGRGTGRRRADSPQKSSRSAAKSPRCLRRMNPNRGFRRPVAKHASSSGSIPRRKRPTARRRKHSPAAGAPSSQ